MQRPAMRLTVGPHPPAVYWRRRALVAVLFVVVVLLVWLALRGGDGGKPAAVHSASAPAAAAPGTGGATGPAAATGTAPAGPGPTDLASPSFVQATPESGTAAATERPMPPPSVPPCGDEQITVTVAVSPSPGVLGGTFTFSIAIANTTAGWCARDLGPGAQEVRVLREGTLLFSSDECAADHRSDVRSFAAGDAVSYRYMWSSYRTTPHTCATAASPAPPGAYQVVARIGTKLSAPVTFTINR
ncbi:hypothetical protein [Dactylosporangium sp. CA-092794]|uniref:hypothetical protein n=1 Tax=Dactylosporangium sp. CA-092794 TaxID=3239929 RepID=UPI003D945258